MAVISRPRGRSIDGLANLRAFIERERASKSLRYGVALAMTALALLGALIIDVPFHLHTNLPFIAAVAISAWYGGRGPGLLASIFSVLLIALFFPRTPGVFDIPWFRQGVYLASFLFVAAIIAETTESMRLARAEAEARAEELEQLNVELEQQMEEVQTRSEHLQESNDALAKAASSAENVAGRTMRLQEATAALSNARTESDVADVVLDRGLSVIEGVRGALARVNGKHLEIIRAVGYPPHLEARANALSLDDSTPLTFAVKTGEPVWLQSLDEFRDRFPWAYQRFGAVSSEQTHVAVPLRHRDEIVGALSVSFADATAVGTTDKALMLLLAQAAADALVRARSFDDEHIARREAETLAQARADVLAIVAHDLRNPLNVITAVGSSLFELDQLPAAERRMVGIMQRCARQMNRLIGDLLDATRLQAGRLTLELTEVDAREVVREADESLQRLAAERRIELRSEAPKQKCVCRADEQRLLQVIENLVGNALKFTPAGGHVTTVARLRGLGAGFSVADDGPGIPPESQARLFHRFWQARIGDPRGGRVGRAITNGSVEPRCG